MADEKAQYAKPASQVDLEERLKNGNKSSAVLSTADTYEAPEPDGEGRTYAVEDNELGEYVGVAGEYATYANDTEKPLQGDDKNPETQVFKSFGESFAAAKPGAVEVADAEESAGETQSGTEQPKAKATSATASKTEQNKG